MDECPCDLRYTIESSQLVKASLERRRHTKKDEDNSAGTDTGNIPWASCKDFTVELGKEQIEAYIRTWEIRSCWLHTLDFLYTTEEEFLTFYHYRARFSTPTAQEPIQGTASVYFAIEISRNKPKTLPVEVYFIVESNRLVHSPGKTSFREKWLRDVIENKTMVQRMVNLWTP